MADLIERQAAIDAIERRLVEPAYQHTGEDWYVGLNSAESELYNLPSAQPEPNLEELPKCNDCTYAKCSKPSNVNCLSYIPRRGDEHGKND